MNEITFGTKRAYHGFLRLTRRGFLSVGLTAARFDMLLAIRGTLRADDHGSAEILQCDLPLVLGVSKSVVSRMLKSLEALGLVDRWVLDEDERFKVVSMTEEGQKAFRAARDLLMRAVQRVAVTAVCFGQRRDRKERRVRLHQLESWLAALRVYFGDKAPLDYEWARKPTPFLREWGPPAMMLRGWQPQATPPRHWRATATPPPAMPPPAMPWAAMPSLAMPSPAMPSPAMAPAAILPPDDRPSAGAAG